MGAAQVVVALLVATATGGRRCNDELHRRPPVAVATTAWGDCAWTKTQSGLVDGHAVLCYNDAPASRLKCLVIDSTHYITFRFPVLRKFVRPSVQWKFEYYLSTHNISDFRG